MTSANRQAILTCVATTTYSIEYLSTGLPDVGIIEEYTITGRGTMLSLDAELTNRAVVYKAGSDEASDPLLNLVHLHVGAKAPNPDRAAAFAEWVISDRGHSVIAGFEKNGQKLYSPAPSNLSDSTLERCSLRMPSYARLY